MTEEELEQIQDIMRSEIRASEERLGKQIEELEQKISKEFDTKIKEIDTKINATFKEINGDYDELLEQVFENRADSLSNLFLVSQSENTGYLGVASGSKRPSGNSLSEKRRDYPRARPKSY